MKEESPKTVITSMEKQEKFIGEGDVHLNYNGTSNIVYNHKITPEEVYTIQTEIRQ